MFPNFHISVFVSLCQSLTLTSKHGAFAEPSERVSVYHEEDFLRGGVECAFTHVAALCHSRHDFFPDGARDIDRAQSVRFVDECFDDFDGATQQLHVRVDGRLRLQICRRRRRRRW